MWARFLIKNGDDEECLQVENVDKFEKIVVSETGTTIHFNNGELRMMPTPLQITIRKDWG